jgi:AraC-like DNA-binding protein
VLSNDQPMFDLFHSILAQRSAAWAAERCSDNLKQLLFMQFKGQIPAMEEAALAMSMSPRSLQRRLMEEGTTFRDIANEVRKDLALQLIQNPAIKLSEVSAILGYSDPAAFRRAFKSWTRESAKAVKHKLKESAA